MPVEREQTPIIDEELVTFLKMKYRNELPKAPIDPVELARLIGQQEVVRFLAGKLEEQARVEEAQIRYPNRFKQPND